MNKITAESTWKKILLMVPVTCGPRIANCAKKHGLGGIRVALLIFPTKLAMAAAPKIGKPGAKLAHLAISIWSNNNHIYIYIYIIYRTIR